MLRIIFGLILGIATILCCSSNKALISAASSGDSCRLFRKEFSIDTSTYKEFSKHLSEFFQSENAFDLLFIKMKGGNHPASELKRWYITDDVVHEMTLTGSGKRTDTFGSNAGKILELATSVENGEYLQVCPYSSNNDSFLLLIKINSTVTFKYASTESDYRGLPISERNKILNVIRLVTFLNS